MQGIDYYTYMSRNDGDGKSVVESIKKIDEERTNCGSDKKSTQLMYEQMLKGLWLQNDPFAM